MVDDMKGILGSGTRDYIWIRISAIILAAYFVVVSSVLILNSPISFDFWNQLYSSFWMKLFTSFSVLAFAIHAWLGTWAVGTDYLTPLMLGGFSKYIYGAYRVACALVILITLFWSIFIIW
jgi:succinate dehydrogenase / fumarate reductase membrane anchor subunit